MKEGFTHFLPLPLRLCGFAPLREILRPEGTGKASGTRRLCAKSYGPKHWQSQWHPASQCQPPGSDGPAAPDCRART